MKATIGDRIFALVMVALLGAVLFIMLGGLVIPLTSFNIIVQYMMFVAIYGMLAGLAGTLAWMVVRFAWVAVRGKW